MKLGVHNALIIRERNKWLKRFGADQLFKAKEINDALNEPLDAQRANAPNLVPHLAYKLKKTTHRDIIRTHLQMNTQMKDVYKRQYQSHKDDPDVLQEETLEAYSELVKQGKVRAIGASNFSAARLAEALEISKQKGYPAYISLQPQYNLYDREMYEQELEPFCIENGLGVITYYSLALSLIHI